MPLLVADLGQVKLEFDTNGVGWCRLSLASGSTRTFLGADHARVIEARLRSALIPELHDEALAALHLSEAHHSLHVCKSHGLVEWTWQDAGSTEVARISLTEDATAELCRALDELATGTPDKRLLRSLSIWPPDVHATRLHPLVAKQLWLHAMHSVFFRRGFWMLMLKLGALLAGAGIGLIAAVQALQLSDSAFQVAFIGSFVLSSVVGFVVFVRATPPLVRPLFRRLVAEAEATRDESGR